MSVYALVAELYPALAEGRKDDVLRLLAADFRADVTPGLPLGIGGKHESAEAMWNDGWMVIGRNYSLTIAPEEWLALEDGRLLVRGLYTGSARSTGREVSAPFAHIWAASDGRLTSLWHLTDSVAWVGALEQSA
jgi:2-(1,2-epoxy-1,2-dihydrophenyl)acetyl-CoA isomerase